MALDANSVHKPFRKLRRLLKNFPVSPSPEDVHDIRTHTRRIEAIVGAFQLDAQKPGSRLTKSLKPIRQAAGAVRDMDVLSDFVATLDPRGDGDCRVRLMQHLVKQRTKAARKLSNKIRANNKEVRSGLRQCSRVADSGLDRSRIPEASEKDIQKVRRKSADSMASSFELEQELRDWPKLNESNIHPFRLKVKKLRYTLELADKSDSKIIGSLGEVKDQVGLWHDWSELAAIAAKVLDHGSACPLSAQIRARAKQEFQKALLGANNLRTQYLAAASGVAARKKGVVAEIHPAMVKAATRLAS
jgi:CHAD domain-containing protein